MPRYTDRAKVMCGVSGCPHSLDEHHGLKGGRCLVPGCPCPKYKRARPYPYTKMAKRYRKGARAHNAARDLKRAEARAAKALARLGGSPVGEVLYKAPADLASHAPADDRDPFLRMVLGAGIEAIRAKLDRLEDGLRR